MWSAKFEWWVEIFAIVLVLSLACLCIDARPHDNYFSAGGKMELRYDYHHLGAVNLYQYTAGSVQSITIPEGIALISFHIW